MLYEHNAWWVLVDASWPDTPFIAYVQALYAERHSGFRNWLATVEYIKRHGYLQAGVAKAVITPPIPCLRWEGKQLTRVYRDLYARVVVLSHRTQRIALVLCDLLGITGELVSEIRQKAHFGCHASVALMSPNISGDFPGEAMAVLENVLEPAVVLCTNGAAGDVDPTLEMPFWGPRSDAMARHLGPIFAAQVLDCFERIEVGDKTVSRNRRPAAQLGRKELILLPSASHR